MAEQMTNRETMLSGRAEQAPMNFSYDSIKDRIYIKMVDTKAHEDILAKAPHRQVLNMSAVPYIRLDDGPGSFYGVLVDHEIMKDMGCEDEKQLFADAVDSMFKNYPLSIHSIEYMMGLAEETDISYSNMYVCTTADKMFGASALLSEDFYREASEKLGGNFYVLPSSIHELMLVPEITIAPEDRGKLTEMVTSINGDENVMKPEDVLTNSAYFYNAGENVLCYAEDAGRNHHREKPLER